MNFSWIPELLLQRTAYGGCFLLFSCFSSLLRWRLSFTDFYVGFLGCLGCSGHICGRARVKLTPSNGVRWPQERIPSSTQKGEEGGNKKLIFLKILEQNKSQIRIIALIGDWIESIGWSLLSKCGSGSEKHWFSNHSLLVFLRRYCSGPFFAPSARILSIVL